MDTTLLDPPAPVRSSRIRELLRLVDRDEVLSLAGGLPALSGRDVARVRAVLDEALAATGPLGPTALQYGPTEGVDELRGLLAARLEVPAERIVVTTGSQQGLDLVARTCCRPGDTVVVEAPSYLGALQAFEAAGARLLAIDGDRDGLDVDRLAETLASGVRPRVVYVVANFANPTGAVLSLARRQALAALADTYGFLVVEDDPYGELRFAGEALPPIASFSDRVVRLGSASKILAPGLRVGWLSGPGRVVDDVARLKQVADLHSPTLNQLIVAALLSDEHGMAAHLADVRARHRVQASALHAALVDRLGDRVATTLPTGGMFSWVRALDGTDTDELFDRALASGVAYVPGSAFAVDGTAPGNTMRLSFATLGPEDLRTAVARLASAWEA